jgi:hypothetical protein
MSGKRLQKMTHYAAVGRVIQFLGVLGIIAIFGVALFTWVHVRFNLQASTPVIQFAPLLLLTIIPVLLISLGRAVRAHKSWARVVAMIFGAVNLILFPIGTLVGGYILWCLAKNWDVQAYAPPATI